MAQPRDQKSPKKAKPRGSRRWLRSIFKWGAVVAIWVTVSVAALFVWFAIDLPDVEEQAAASRRPTTMVLDRRGAVLAASGDLYGGPVRVGDLPPALPQAVIATEDRRFYEHFGLDLIGLTRATYTNLRAGRVVQGGSTITQQVAKNLFLTPDRTIKRKAQEAMLAIWLEWRFTKDEILTLYLNRVYFGAGTYGVEAAAQRYFGRRARDLGLYESALIAGLLKAPSRYNPLNNPDLAASRARQVLANMVNAGMLEAKVAEVALADPRWRRAAAPPGSKQAAYFVDWVLGQVPDFTRGVDADLTVVTSLDAKLQRIVEQHTFAMMSGRAAKAGVSQVAVVVMATDGAIRAMVGGADYAFSQFNRAVQARRQPGSAFKPFVYLAALEAGRNTDTIIEDAPLQIGDWNPENFDGRYEGAVTLRHALAHSINTVAVRLARDVGTDAVIHTAQRLGIGGTFPSDLSIALGTSSVSPIELTAAYATFANGGFGAWPHAVMEIRDGANKTLYRRDGSGANRVMPPSLMADMNAMLSAVIAGGSGKAAALNRPAAGKTGTSQDFRDAWFVGYTADLVAGVWMGNDDGKSMRGVTGGGLPARLWRVVMMEAHGNLPPRSLPGMERPSAAALRPKALGGAPEEPGFWQNLFGKLTGG